MMRTKIIKKAIEGASQDVSKNIIVGEIHDSDQIIELLTAMKNSHSKVMTTFLGDESNMKLYSDNLLRRE
ncbi:hypothetical protein NE686_17395 [Tissierella carlieri]|uniref:Uncharacterized protein n=1 Tax=Tissierella carlieri TaxID=689904 RepID=A0ABT1SEH0_9FIRM|nr:hypothetical protein [Tissierella carlieri]MCQ4924881.1 hypothetical protein [Tissierella carlieri]